MLHRRGLGDVDLEDGLQQVHGLGQARGARMR